MPGKAGHFLLGVKLMEIIKNNIYEAQITDITNEGNGICKLDGYTVFIPLTAIGDKIKLKLIKVNKNFGYGKVEEILSPSPTRIEDNCPVFTTCGGCSLRHISYKAELSVKENIVKSAFERIGKIKTPINDIIGSELTEGYRNKAQYPFSTSKEGKVTAGFFAKRSHRVIPCENCKLQPTIFSQILDFTVDFANKNKITAYDEQKLNGILRNLYLRKSQHTQQIMVCLVVTKRLPIFENYAKELTKRFKTVSSVMLNINRKNTNVILGDKYEVIYGNDYITDTVCGVSLNISPAAFYQVNHKQCEVLYNKAKEYANLKGNETVIDLYCGTGSIGLSMADKTANLIGADIVPESINNARQNALNNNILNTEFICADASLAAQTLANRNIRPDVVIVDPPRKGCDSACIDAICSMSPQRIVYISCNPATVARDCAIFTDQGYSVDKIQPVDMFPRTTHIETVVLMSRKER